MLRMELAGAHTRLHSTLCSTCPQGSAGCCASPPGVEWSDVGRIVALGGLAWLLDRLVSGELRPGGRGLLMARVERTDPGREAPSKRCVFHGPHGCTIPPDRRAATCNYYVCDDAFAQAGDADTAAGRRVHDLLVEQYGRWDQELARRVSARWPMGPGWSSEFLCWLGQEYQRLVDRDAKALPFDPHDRTDGLSNGSAAGDAP